MSTVAVQKRQTNLSLLPPRLALGAAMLYHGTQKLSSDGLAQSAQFFENVGIRPGKPWTLATGIAEVGAGVLTVAGLATRAAALAVLVTQGMAIAKVHASKGYNAMSGGYEYNLALVAMAAALLIRGPGGISLHEWFEHRVEGRGAHKWRRRARPSPLLRAIKLVK